MAAYCLADTVVSTVVCYRYLTRTGVVEFLVSWVEIIHHDSFQATKVTASLARIYGKFDSPLTEFHKDVPECYTFSQGWPCHAYSDTVRYEPLLFHFTDEETETHKVTYPRSPAKAGGARYEPGSLVPQQCPMWRLQWGGWQASPPWHPKEKLDKLLCRFTTGPMTVFQEADEQWSRASTLTSQCVHSTLLLGAVTRERVT